MKILFIRHGESIDDIEDRYGGSADFDLTKKGKAQISEAAKKILALDESFEVILSSPLKRAFQSAEMLSTALTIPIEIYEYLQERNLNGVLTGLVRSEAQEKYPEQVAHHNKWEFVDGSEREADFTTRVHHAITYLLRKEYHTLIAVTHGLFLKTFFKEYMQITCTHVGDGGFVMVESHKDSFSLITLDGITYDKDISQ